jgi:hypothetical protein
MWFVVGVHLSHNRCTCYVSGWGEQEEETRLGASQKYHDWT